MLTARQSTTDKPITVFLVAGRPDINTTPRIQGMEYVQNNYGHAHSCSGNCRHFLYLAAMISLNQPRIRTGEANGVNNKGVSRHRGGRLLSGHR